MSSAKHLVHIKISNSGLDNAVTVEAHAVDNVCVLTFGGLVSAIGSVTLCTAENVLKEGELVTGDNAQRHYDEENDN